MPGPLFITVAQLMKLKRSKLRFSPLKKLTNRSISRMITLKPIPVKITRIEAKKLEVAPTRKIDKTNIGILRFDNGRAVVQNQKIRQFELGCLVALGSLNF